jgi:hypothetical protein
MDKGVLVAIDLQRGEKVISALEENGVPLSAALWAHFPEYEDWRLVLASRKLDSLKPGDAYLKVNRIMDRSGITVREAPAIFIMKTTDPFVRSLRRVFGKAKSVSGMRLGGQKWGDRYVEDGYAYKIA